MDHLLHRVNKPGEGAALFDDGTATPDLPAHSYVTALELGAALGVTDVASDVWLEPACSTATLIVDQYVGPAGVERWLTVPPVHESVHVAALTVAVDVYRRRTAAAGYFDASGYLARLALDPTATVAGLLAPFVLDIGVG